MECYEIRLKNKVVGKATVERQGLYYKVTCNCHLPVGTRYHATVRGTDGEEDLGLMIPSGSAFYSSKSVAVKKLGEGKLTFSLEPAVSDSQFIPLAENMPIECLAQLRKAVLTEKNGVCGLMIPTR